MSGNKLTEVHPNHDKTEEMVDEGLDESFRRATRRPMTGSPASRKTINRPERVNRSRGHDSTAADLRAAAI